jgi:hypothetical protein
LASGKAPNTPYRLRRSKSLSHGLIWQGFGNLSAESVRFGGELVTAIEREQDIGRL